MTKYKVKSIEALPSLPHEAVADEEQAPSDDEPEPADDDETDEPNADLALQDETEVENMPEEKVEAASAAEPSAVKKTKTSVATPKKEGSGKSAQDPAGDSVGSLDKAKPQEEATPNKDENDASDKDGKDSFGAGTQITLEL